MHLAHFTMKVLYVGVKVIALCTRVYLIDRKEIVKVQVVLMIVFEGDYKNKLKVFNYLRRLVGNKKVIFRIVETLNSTYVGCNSYLPTHIHYIFFRYANY